MKLNLIPSYRNSIERGNSFKNKSREKGDSNLKMSHADAAAWCVQIVELFKGDKQRINKECEKIRDIYFSQNRRK